MSMDDAAERFETPEALRDFVGEPMDLAANKVLPALDAHCRRFIALSPFLVIGTMSREGRADVSPRGDAPGFVQVLDDRTLAIPDRPGNRRADTMMNIVENPSVGLIFLVPGMDETLRVNGRAAIVREPDLLAAMTANRKVPRLAIRVDIAEAFLHCGKALKRARLWDPATRIDRRDFPTLGRMVVDQLHPKDLTVEGAEILIEENYRNELY